MYYIFNGIMALLWAAVIATIVSASLITIITGLRDRKNEEYQKICLSDVRKNYDEYAVYSYGIQELTETQQVDFSKVYLITIFRDTTEEDGENYNEFDYACDYWYCGIGVNYNGRIEYDCDLLRTEYFNEY